jgi:hypothetical protein
MTKPITTAEAAEVIGLNIVTLRGHIRSGRLQAVWNRYARRWEIEPTELERFKRERQVGAGRPKGSRDSKPRKSSKHPPEAP